MKGNNYKLHIHTPVIESTPLSKINERMVYLKLENTQPCSNFKIRGIGYKMQKDVTNGIQNFVTSSGGNAGLAAAYAARKLGKSLKIFVPGSTDNEIIEKLRDEKADVEVIGSVWDHANEKALEYAKTIPFSSYVHPFDNPDVWEGHSTMIEELAQDIEKPETIVLSVGGGGLAMGVITGMMKVGWTDVNLVTVETIGADCFIKSVKENKRITLPDITSVAKSLGSLTVCKTLFDEYLKKTVKIIPIVVTDKEAVMACKMFLDDHRMLVEPACGATLAGLYSKNNYDLAPNGGSIIGIVCGGVGISLQRLDYWLKSID